MVYAKYLQKAVDYIEDNINQPLSVEACASAAGFSKYYFYRLFSVYAGFSVMEYIRKRRLAYAMEEVCKGRRILDIALDYGYGSERSFCRAFIQTFGKSPVHFRGSPYTVPPKPDLTLSLNNTTGGESMEQLDSTVRFVHLAFMAVAGATVVGSNPEEEAAARLESWSRAHGIDPKARKFGFDVPVSEKEQKAGYRGYEYWVCVPEGTEVPEGMSMKPVDACKYAVLRITDPFSDPFSRIPQGWRRLVDWCQKNSLRSDCNKQRYCLEEVIEEEGRTYMDIYIPVE